MSEVMLSGRDIARDEVAAILALGDDTAFRLAVREWLARHLRAVAGPLFGHAGMHALPFRRRFEDHLCRAGLSGLGWPRAYGGCELPLERQAIFHEEYARSGAPLPLNMVGHGILGPTLIAFGSEAQQRRFLPALLKNEHIWCQGYSEPGAGSDLASLGTRAERVPGGYRVTGQKIWTSFASEADWCFALARSASGGPRHQGLTFLLVPMSAEGVRVRPIRQITGEADFNEVFFENVFVAEQNRVGAENAGWRIAMAAASFERGTYFVPRIARLKIELDDLVRLAHERGALGEPAVRERLLDLGMDVHALRLHARDMLERTRQGTPPGAEGSAVKLLWSETHQRLYDLAMDVLGPLASFGPQEADAPREGRWQREYLWTRAETILAGTSEVQRNILGERALGLPR